MSRRTAMAAALAILAALMTAPALATTSSPAAVVPATDGADPSMPPGIPQDGSVAPEPSEPAHAQAPSLSATPSQQAEPAPAQTTIPEPLPSTAPQAPAIVPTQAVPEPSGPVVAEAPATAPALATAAASDDPAPASPTASASADLSAGLGAARMPVDPLLVSGSAGLALGILLAALWLMAMRRAQVARVREAAAAQSRASAAIEQRTLRRARSRSSHDLIVDAPKSRPPTTRG